MAILQAEAQRFEEAIVSTSTEGGRPGIVQLPGVKSIMEVVGIVFKKSKMYLCIFCSRSRLAASCLILGGPYAHLQPGRMPLPP